MKSTIIFFLSAIIITFFAACDKVEVLPLYQNGSAPILTASSSSIAPAAADSDKTALTLNWTYTKQATDSSTIKFVIDIDTTGNNFSKTTSTVVSGALTASFTAKDLNNILLIKGYAFNVPVSMDVRVTSSYANNNERLSSNVLKLNMTPYKIPPKVAIPATGMLFIVGDATDFGWTNDPAPPAFPPIRQLTQISETQWAGIFNMKGTGGYKLLQKQGDWETQFHMIEGGTANAGDFEQKNSDPSFPSPAIAGAYKVDFDFQTGKYAVTKVDNALPATLYITGDATMSGWTNSPPSTQQFSEVTNGVFELTMNFTGTGSYKFLSSSGNWQPQFGGTSATGGDISANYGSGTDPGSINSPTVAGSYKMQVNFITSTYSITKM